MSNGREATAAQGEAMTGHLIHIGFPKAGSNFLRRWFAAHPELAFVEGGIAGFRNVYDIARQSTLSQPALRFRVTSSEGLATPHAFVGLDHVEYGEIAEGSLANGQKQSCDTLATLFPNAHVLIVTRGIRAMILSTYSQYVRSGGVGGLADAAEGMKGDLRAWEYDRVIELYREAFGGRVILLPFELLLDDSGCFLRELEERLGLGHGPPPGNRLNPALSSEELSWYPRMTRLVRRLPVGQRIGRRLLRLHVGLTMRGRLRPAALLLDRIRPLLAVTLDTVPDHLVEAFRGSAEVLRGETLYAPYADAYLF